MTCAAAANIDGRSDSHTLPPTKSVSMRIESLIAAGRPQTASSASG